MSDSNIKKTIGILLCLVCIRGLLYGLIIPANQYPDELYHFLSIKAKQAQLNLWTEQKKSEIASQVEYTLYYLSYPEITSRRTPETFTEISLPPSPSSRHLYYVTMAWILNAVSFDRIVNDFYLIRGISILCGMIVVFLAFLVARELFPENVLAVLSVPILISLIPQFSAMNGAINNDKLAEVFTAALFLLVVKMVKQNRLGWYFWFYCCVLVLAISSKRTAFFLLPFTLVFLFVYLWKSSLGVKMHLVFFSGIVGLVAGFLVLQAHWEALDSFISNHIILSSAYRMKWFFFREQLYSFETLKYYMKFFTVIYWSFWGNFGYMSIHLHHFWYLGTAVLQLFSIGGLLHMIVQVKRASIKMERWKVKLFYLFAWSILLAVSVLFLRSIIFRGVTADFTLTQGRYLFTVVIPISVLTVAGLYHIISSRYHRLMAILSVLGLVTLDMVCLSKYLLLNFHFISLF